MARRAALSICLTGACLWALDVPPAYGQMAAGEITGRVKDQAGAAVPGATITVTVSPGGPILIHSKCDLACGRGDRFRRASPDRVTFRQHNSVTEEALQCRANAANAA